MPITEKGFEYTMPPEIKTMISNSFCQEFVKQIHLIHGFGLEYTEIDVFVYEGGTCGWEAAFALTCKKYNLDELYIYYSKLPWYDSDLFDGELTDILIEYKLIVPGSIQDEIAKQLGVNRDCIVQCDKCGEYYDKYDVISTDEEGCMEAICLTCAGAKEVNPLKWEKTRTFKETLGMNENDFFLCDKCGYTHFASHKGNRFCLSCEAGNSIKDRNKYYREIAVPIRNEYHDRLFPNTKEGDTH